MKSRVEATLDSEMRSSSPLISTFHSLCVRILRRNVEALNAGYTRNFTIYDNDQLTTAALRDATREYLNVRRYVQVILRPEKN